MTKGSLSISVLTFVVRREKGRRVKPDLEKCSNWKSCGLSFAGSLRQHTLEAEVTGRCSELVPETAALCEKASVAAATSPSAHPHSPLSKANRLMSSRLNTVFLVSSFLHRFWWIMRFLSSAEPGRSTEDQRQQHGGETRPTLDPCFLLDPRRNSIQHHSLQDAWDTLELVRLLRALQINVPVSISFCRSTPFMGKKI